MKLTINPKDVSNDLKRANRVIGNKNIIAILDNFMFNIVDGKMSVTASDGEIRLTLPLSIISADSDFSFCVDASRFTQAVDAVNSETMDITFGDDSILTCKHRKGKFNIAYASADDYPTVNTLDDVTAVNVGCDVISNILDNTSYAAGNDQLHVALMGVYFDFTEHGLVGVATDTRKLVRVKSNTAPQSAKSFIMPIKVANVMKQFIDNTEDVISIKGDNNCIVFESSERFTLTFRQISGKYPQYERVIPQASDNRAVIDKNELLESLSRSLLFSPTKTSALRLTFTINKLTIETQDLDYNLSSNEEIPCSYSGKDFVIGFDGTALHSIVNKFDGQQIVFNLYEPNRAIIIQYENSDAIIALLMPMIV